MEERYNCAGMTNQRGDDVYTYDYHPGRESGSYREPKKFIHIDTQLSAAYLEVVRASNYGLRIAAAMGVRALLEGVCVEQGIDDKAAWGLTKKIAILQTKTGIPDGIVDGLIRLKIIGDGAAHSLDAPSSGRLSLSVDLLEALLTHLYEAKFDLKEKAEKVVRDRGG